MSWRLLLPLAALLTVTACRRADPGLAPSAGPVLPVATAVVTVERLPVLLETPATVRPAERATIAAKVTGTITTFPLGLGRAVAAGDVLLTVNSPETEARVRQARAQLAEAERNADRARTLVDKGVNAPDSVRDAVDRFSYAQAAAAEAEAMLAYATVRAPFAGVITTKHVLPGDLATLGLPLLVLESTQHLRAEGSIPEKAAAGLRSGDELTVLLEDDAAAVTGQLEEISAAADAVSHSVLAKVSLPPGRARSGQFARLKVKSGTSETITVPASAVARFGQIERIFVIEQGRAVLRLVKTGRTLQGRIEILAGLNAGEQIVLSPPSALRDGQAVALTP